MLYVGNDVVDLEERGTRGKRDDEAFVERILTVEERRRWKENSRRDETLWLLWAAKEAAYKVASKIHPGCPFIPRHFDVSFSAATVSGHLAEDLHPGSVFAKGRQIPCQALITREYIHVLALWPPAAFSRMTAAVHRIEINPESPPDESQLVRDLAIAAIARHCQWQPGDMEIKRFPLGKRWGPPLLFHKGEAAPGDLSLSHDGRFLAYAYTGRSTGI